MDNWINVKDRLPDKRAWVLVYADGAMGCMGFDRGEFSDWNHNPPERNNVFIPDITHWMELPKPPIDEKEVLGQ